MDRFIARRGLLWLVIVLSVAVGRPSHAADAPKKAPAKKTAGGDEVQQAIHEGSAAVERLIAKIQAELAKSEVNQEAVDRAEAVARGLEKAGKAELAARAYQRFGKLLAQNREGEIAARGLKLQGAARRLGLVGKPMPLEGTTLDGRPLRWTDYRGKVVLVNFWATWCPYCRKEMPNIRANYDRYHDRGFEVIGYSNDEDREALEAYLRENKIPWENLLSTDPQATGRNSPMSVRYGILSIPTSILVGKDGKVVSLQARGSELGKLLEKLLGPAEEKKAKG
jgi:thiol-disulfide isomerase/thioredoxin